MKTERRTKEGTFLTLINLFLALFLKRNADEGRCRIGSMTQFVGQTVDILLRQNFSVTDGVT